MEQLTSSFYKLESSTFNPLHSVRFNVRFVLTL